MGLRQIESGQLIGARRGDVVVCIPVHGGHDHAAACLRSVLANTGSGVLVLICDDASPDRGLPEQLLEIVGGQAGDRELLYLRHPVNIGFPANANHAFATAAPADVVLLNSDCIVAEGWLEGLRAAAYSGLSVATATALTNHGTIVSVPERSVPVSTLPGAWRIDTAAAAVRAHSLRLRPQLLTAVGHCIYVRRSALELVGEFDLAFSPGYGEEVDFSQRCLRQGLSHVAADDVLVFHHGGRSFAGNGAAGVLQAEHEQLLAARYPYYHGALRVSERDRSGPLPRALGAARRALMGLRVVIDPGGLTDARPETHARIRDLAAALEQTNGVRVAVAHTAGPQGDRADVRHRIGPVSDLEELTMLAAGADRLVLSQRGPLDYNNPSRFGSGEAWEDHRKLCRATLAAADHVIFATPRDQSEAIAEGLVAPERTSVIEARPGGGAIYEAGEARRLIEIYTRACESPPVAAKPGSPVVRPGVELSEDAIRLVGADRALPIELERPLLALATHPSIGRLVFGAIKAGYGISHRLRRAVKTSI